MNEEDLSILILSGYVKRSSYRFKVVQSLSHNNVMMPTEIADDTDIRTNHISNVLSELKNKDIIECINEDAYRGRLYRLTSIGKSVWDILS